MQYDCKDIYIALLVRDRTSWDGLNFFGGYKNVLRKGCRIFQRCSKTEKGDDCGQGTDLFWPKVVETCLFWAVNGYLGFELVRAIRKVQERNSRSMGREQII